MSPEQARGDKLIGPATDVWALGAILYRLTTGRPPFQGANSFDTIVKVIETEPVPPRTLTPSVPRDLDTICLKCLRKDSATRYVSANELAEDLCSYLNGKPIAARPVMRAERAWKWVKRNKAVSALLVCFVLALVVGTSGIYLNYREAKMHEADAKKKAKLANTAQANAEFQAGIAVENANAAQKQAQIADEQRNLALDSFHDVVYDFQVRLKQFSSNLAIRQHMLETSLRGLDKVGWSKNTTARVFHERIWAYHELSSTYNKGSGAEHAGKRRFYKLEACSLPFIAPSMLDEKEFKPILQDVVVALSEMRTILPEWKHADVQKLYQKGFADWKRVQLSSAACLLILAEQKMIATDPEGTDPHQLPNVPIKDGAALDDPPQKLSRSELDQRVLQQLVTAQQLIKNAKIGNGVTQFHNVPLSIQVSSTADGSLDRSGLKALLKALYADFRAIDPDGPFTSLIK